MAVFNFVWAVNRSHQSATMQSCVKEYHRTADYVAGILIPARMVLVFSQKYTNNDCISRWSGTSSRSFNRLSMNTQATSARSHRFLGLAMCRPQHVRDVGWFQNPICLCLYYKKPQLLYVIAVIQHKTAPSNGFAQSYLHQ